MSIPISYCAIVKACDDEEYRKEFIKIMKYNLSCGAYTTFSCKCEPKCREITKEENEMLSDLLKEKK